MTRVDDLLSRNARFAATDATEHLPAIPFIPNRQVYVITCIDPRVDPADVFEFSLGDAIVHRMVGGRVTEAVIDDLAWISYLHETRTPDADWFDLVVMHHTDCGSGLMADDATRAGFVGRGFDDAVLRGAAVLDPSETVRIDVERLRASETISPRIRISGLAYDTASGVATLVVPPEG